MAASVPFFNGTSCSNPEKNQKLRIMLPTRWPQYSLFIFAILFGLFLPAALSIFWRWIRGDARLIKSETAASQIVPGRAAGEREPIAIRFYLAALLFMGFFALALLLVPLLFAVRTEQMIPAALSIGGVAIPFVIVIFYCIRKGDLSWNIHRSREDRWESE